MSKEISNMLDQYSDGKISKEEIIKYMSKKPFVDLGFAKLDTHRSTRRGFPEVIYCASKTPEQVKKIFLEMKKTGDPVLATKATREHHLQLLSEAKYDPVSKLMWYTDKEAEKRGKIVVISAGTSDEPIAEEAAKTAEIMGNVVVRKYDIGVAGIHRLVDAIDDFQDCNVIIAVAGMEGALGTIVSGISSKPVIAVPTSVGYGASFQGIAPLLTMLNSCSPGIAVVNIDNGFGAAYIASMINKK